MEIQRVIVQNQGFFGAFNQLAQIAFQLIISLFEILIKVGSLLFINFPRRSCQISQGRGRQIGQGRRRKKSKGRGRPTCKSQGRIRQTRQGGRRKKSEGGGRKKG